METYTTYVLGVDPGTTTGIALAEFTAENAKAVWSRQLPWDQAADEIAMQLGKMKALQRREPETGLLAVGERFMVTAQSYRRGQQGIEDSIGMLGVLRRETRLAGVEMAAPQQSSAVLKLVADYALHNLGLWPAGKHERDAYRHAVACALKRRLLEPKTLIYGGHR